MRKNLAAVSTSLAIGVFIAGFAFTPNAALAQARGAAPAKGGGLASLSPDALGAKAFLEDLLARRYTQELSTLVDREQFSLGAQLDLIPVASPVLQTPKPTDSEPLNDLMLGSLDADQLLKGYMGVAEEKPASKLLDHFRIKSVNVSVGLKADLNPQIKAEVEGWLKKRLSAEFGGAGKGAVTFIKTLEKPKDVAQEPKVKTIYDWLGEFQSLAGQIVISLAILIGVILYRLLSRGEGGLAADANGMGSSEDSSDLAALQRAAAEVQADNDKDLQADLEFDSAERVRANNDIESLKSRIIELVPRLSGYLEDVVRNWCHMGENGKLRLACFAEAAGKETGKLPIPVDALPDVQKIFARMPEIHPRDKRESLEKAYWDLLSVLNLGSDSLSTPFAYLDGLNLSMVNKVLMEQNPKLRTVVSLYMTNDLRQRYLKSLSMDAKREILESAAGLSEIRAEELETLDRSLLLKLNPTREQEIVALEMTLPKIVAALTPSEEIMLLAQMKGPAIEEYKRTTASLAFLAEWPDDKIRIVFMGMTPDELISFLRVRPDLQERCLSMASMMVGEIARDELSRPDKTSATDKDKALEFFTTRIKGLVQSGEINLMEVFGPVPTATTHQIGTDDEAKRVA